VRQVTDFVNTPFPTSSTTSTAGRGPFGWLQDEYQIVDRIRAATREAGRVGASSAVSEPVLDIVRSVVTAVVGA
jgi:hypothetical protein